MDPCQFWRLHPVEFWWLAEGYREKVQIQKRGSGRLTEDDALELADELKHARVRAGVSPE